MMSRICSDHAMAEEAINESWELGPWIIRQLMGEIHERDLNSIIVRALFSCIY